MGAIKRIAGKSFEELLIERGLVSKQKMQEILLRVEKEKKGIEQILLESGLSEEKILIVKAEFLGYEFVNVSASSLSTELIKHINPAYVKNYKILPFKYEDNNLTLAMVEPRDFIAMDEVVRLYKNARFVIKNVKVVMTTTKYLFSAIEKYYSPHQKKEEVELESILNQVATTYKQNVEVAELSKKEATENSAPVVMLANKIVEKAFLKRASDIHLEPASEFMKIRNRIDGEMMDAMIIPKYAQDAIIARFKIMADMRIDERRLPQDGRIDFTRYNPTLEIDLRVSTIPTPFGEDVVLRILDKKSSILSLDMLGLDEHSLKIYKDAINLPYGLILHVGPTGSGKTTALYAALKALDSPDTKILTAEDPIEYSLGGNIIQSNINPAIGYTFARALRAFMRHDPDIILIGEIRDVETAKTTIEASLTGHLVFSTLHTNDAVGTVIRLTEMGIEPYLVADSLIAVCAQRLIRRICSNCKISYIATDEDLETAKGEISPKTTLYKGMGCKICEGSGYKGRIGIYELLFMNKTLRNLLLKKGNTEDLKKAAVETGMRTLRQDALKKAISGITSLEEVVRNTLPDD